MRFLLSGAMGCLIVAGVLHFLQVETLHQIIAVQKQQLALCRVPEGPTWKCEAYAERVFRDTAITEHCIKITNYQGQP